MRLRRLLFLLPLSIMVIIFMFSAQTAGESLSVSDGLVYNIVSNFCRWLNIKNANINVICDSLRTIVRKSAHFSIYAMLGISFVISLHFNFRFKLKRQLLLLSQVFSSAYAITDELHQLFISGRSGNFTDVLLDSFGAFFGVIIVYILFFRKK